MDNDDDIFDENASELEIIQQTWNKIKRDRYKNGYIEGATKGQEGSIQEGFNTGFKEGIVCSFLISKIKGILTAILAYYSSYESHTISGQIFLDSKSLLENISNYETNSIAQDLLSMKIESPVNLLHDLENMEVNSNEHSTTQSISITDGLNNFSCPEIVEIVEKCKNILHRMNWTDSVIDTLCS